MKTKEKTINLHESNRITYESLHDISGSIFEEVYLQADRTLTKVIKDNKVYKEDKDKDMQSLNVISFLGGRGRGKTSAMLSFLAYLDELQYKDEWSEINKDENIKFLVLPYIDAAMLADAEYIIDVILAEMWDKFEGYMKRSSVSHEADFERLGRDITQQFINVRQAYLLLKKRESGEIASGELDVPVPSALHELAASIHLRHELQKLINNYLEIFQYNISRKECEYYLVIAIDDVDMSGQKAHFILEQIRRFLRMQKVIIFITADIDRLQLACESRYEKVYIDSNDRRKFINEYLEKVLPYNMRIYLPEVKERHGDILVNTLAKAELELESDNEKDIILEFMVKKCGIHFDGCRRKRHFLQNQSMRSMVNYFEQMVRMKGEYLSWLKVDLRERIIERIPTMDQKKFMMELLAKDYEDINSYIITYLESDFEYFGNVGQEKSMGQVLCACRQYEESNAQNAEFVDAVIMLYSIILKQADTETKMKVLGASLWGEREYGLISSESEKAPFCLSFDLLGSLKLQIKNSLSDEELQNKDVLEILEQIVGENEVSITAWLCSLLFVTLDSQEETEFTFMEEYLEINPGQLTLIKDKGIEELLSLDLLDLPIEEESVENTTQKCWILDLRPMANARKNYLTNAFREQEEVKEQCHKLVLGILGALVRWIEIKRGEQNILTDRNKQLEKMCNAILKKSGVISEKKGKTGGEEQIDISVNVEMLYSMNKVLSNQIRTYEFNEKEAYRILQSAYKAIKTELERRDRYFSERINIVTKFSEKFENSLPAKMLLVPESLGKLEREKFEEKLGSLLMEYRGKTTTLQKKGPVTKQ